VGFRGGEPLSDTSTTTYFRNGESGGGGKFLTRLRTPNKRPSQAYSGEGKRSNYLRKGLWGQKDHYLVEDHPKATTEFWRRKNRNQEADSKRGASDLAKKPKGKRKQPPEPSERKKTTGRKERDAKKVAVLGSGGREKRVEE